MTQLRTFLIHNGLSILFKEGPIAYKTYYLRQMKIWNTSPGKQRQLSKMLDEWAVYVRRKYGNKQLSSSIYLSEAEPFLEQYASNEEVWSQVLGWHIHLTIQNKTTIELKLCRSISYAAVGAHADQTSRRKLAPFQVPLLLGIGEKDTAPTKATESGDTDLVYLVLFHIWQKRLALELFGMIQARLIAHDLFIRDSRYHILA
ncbi:unnamed protein product [Lactuca saligna]|uniref:Vps16 C-terminal domain-containing protein n=1 Tax=Lactuca saligna TaxID=75948 RepID=A0AA36A012_LACSI|nr:unnamed protein product [Lactuca saligna]